MQKITYTNINNESVTLSRTFPYLLQNLDGLGAPPATPMQQKGFQQDGVNHFGNLLEPRTINFRAVVQDTIKSGLIAKREEIMRVFNPGLPAGILTYENEGKKYRIIASAYDGPHEITARNARTAIVQSFDIGLFCPLPAWESYVETSLKMVGFIGGLMFATGVAYYAYWNEWSSSSGGTRFPMSFATTGDQVEIHYDGTLDAPLLIEFRGPATLPKITKLETGEFIGVNLELLEGEKLYIDTKPSAVNVYKDDGEGNITPAFNYINPLTAYFLLTTGMNTISFSATLGNPEVYLYYREQFVGV